MSGNAGQQAKEDFKINGQYVDTPRRRRRNSLFDGTWRRHHSIILIVPAKAKEPFFMSINFMKVHQPNMPHPDYIHKSLV